MKVNNFIKFFFLITFIFTPINKSIAEKFILSACDNKIDGFLKNEYILDLKKSLMIRNFVYTDKTYKKYRMNDLSIKKKNTVERFIYKENQFILTDKIGYPQFYTQLLFEIDNPNIKIKTVINNEEGISEMSICKKIERFKEKS